MAGAAAVRGAASSPRGHAVPQQRRATAGGKKKSVAARMRKKSSRHSKPEPAQVYPKLDVAGVYLRNCAALGIQANSVMAARLPKGEKSFEDLESLSAENAYIGEKGAMATLELVRLCPNLRSIDLSGNGLTDSAVETLLVHAADHPSVTSLDLSNNKISQDSIAQLKRVLRGNRRIVDVRLDGNPNVFAAALKDVQILAGFNRSTVNGDLEILRQGVKPEVLRSVVERLCAPPPLTYQARKERLFEWVGTRSIGSIPSRDCDGWATVSVFINATFSDFHTEVHIISHKVIPELNSYLRRFKIRLVPIDLHQSKQYNCDNIENICNVKYLMESMRGSSDIFLSLHGEVLGWVPSVDEIPPSESYDRMRTTAAIQPTSLAQLSFQEMFEARDTQRSAPLAFFYFRSPEVTEGLPHALKPRYRDAGHRRCWNSMEKSKIASALPDALKYEGYGAQFKTIDRFGQIHLCRTQEFEETVQSDIFNCIEVMYSLGPKAKHGWGQQQQAPLPPPAGGQAPPPLPHALPSPQAVPQRKGDDEASRPDTAEPPASPSPPACGGGASAPADGPPLPSAAQQQRVGLQCLGGGPDPVAPSAHARFSRVGLDNRDFDAAAASLFAPVGGFVGRDVPLAEVRRILTTSPAAAPPPATPLPLEGASAGFPPRLDLQGVEPTDGSLQAQLPEVTVVDPESSNASNASRRRAPGSHPRACVLLGDPGCGKSSLVAQIVQQASGMRVAEAGDEGGGEAGAEGRQGGGIRHPPLVLRYFVEAKGLVPDSSDVRSMITSLYLQSTALDGGSRYDPERDILFNPRPYDAASHLWSHLGRIARDTSRTINLFVDSPESILGDSTPLGFLINSSGEWRPPEGVRVFLSLTGRCYSVEEGGGCVGGKRVKTLDTLPVSRESISGVSEALRRVCDASPSTAVVPIPRLLLKERRCIIEAALSSSGVTLDPTEADAFIWKPDSILPGYCRLLCDELLHMTRYASLGKAISSAPGSLPNLIHSMLATRIGRESNAGGALHLTRLGGLLAVSRAGLTEVECREVLMRPFRGFLPPPDARPAAKTPQRQVGGKKPPEEGGKSDISATSSTSSAPPACRSSISAVVSLAGGGRAAWDRLGLPGSPTGALQRYRPGQGNSSSNGRDSTSGKTQACLSEADHLQNPAQAVQHAAEAKATRARFWGRWGHSPRVLPGAVWSRLAFELQPFLCRRVPKRGDGMTEAHVLCPTGGSVGQAASRFFLGGSPKGSLENAAEFHAELGAFYLGKVYIPHTPGWRKAMRECIHHLAKAWEWGSILSLLRPAFLWRVLNENLSYEVGRDLASAWDDTQICLACLPKDSPSRPEVAAVETRLRECCQFLTAFGDLHSGRNVLTGLLAQLAAPEGWGVRSQAVELFRRWGVSHLLPRTLRFYADRNPEGPAGRGPICLASEPRSTEVGIPTLATTAESEIVVSGSLILTWSSAVAEPIQLHEQQHAAVLDELEGCLIYPGGSQAGGRGDVRSGPRHSPNLSTSLRHRILGVVYLWDLEGALCRRVTHPDLKGAPVACATASRDGTRALIASENWCLQLWDISLPMGGSRLMRCFQLPARGSASIRGCCFSWEPVAKPFSSEVPEKGVCVFDTAGHLLLWDGHDAPAKQMRQSSNGILSVAFSPGCAKMVAAYEDSAVASYSLAGDTIAPISSYVAVALPKDVRFLPDTSCFVLILTDRKIVVWNSDTGAEVRKLEVRCGFKGAASLFYSEGCGVVLADPGSQVAVWRVEVTRGTVDITESTAIPVASWEHESDQGRSVWASRGPVCVGAFASGVVSFVDFSGEAPSMARCFVTDIPPSLAGAHCGSASRKSPSLLPLCGIVALPRCGDGGDGDGPAFALVDATSGVPLIVDYVRGVHHSGRLPLTHTLD